MIVPRGQRVILSICPTLVLLSVISAKACLRTILNSHIAILFPLVFQIPGVIIEDSRSEYSPARVNIKVGELVQECIRAIRPKRYAYTNGTTNSGDN